MVISSLDFDVGISKSPTKSLVMKLKQIESSLDDVARDIDIYSDTKTNNGITLSLKYEKLINLEKKLSEQWSTTYEALLNFTPRTHEETSEAMVALIDLHLAGHNSEQIMRTLKRLAIGFKRCE
jgi:hypothetical protein